MKKFFFFLCVAVMGLTGCLGKSIEDKLAKDLDSPKPEVRLEAARQLSDVATAEAIRILLIHKDDSDYRVKEAIKKALKKIDARTFLN